MFKGFRTVSCTTMRLFSHVVRSRGKVRFKTSISVTDFFALHFYINFRDQKLDHYNFFIALFMLENVSGMNVLFFINIEFWMFYLKSRNSYTPRVRIK